MILRKTLLLSLLSIFISGHVFAGADSNINSITALRFSEEGVYVQFENTPAACHNIECIAFFKPPTPTMTHLVVTE